MIADTRTAVLLKDHPELFAREAAKRQLLWFAQYMQASFRATPFHRSYYRVLDLFARGKIRKNDV